MNRIAKAFAGGKAFIPFVTAGDPSADKTVEYILEMEKAGADLIELGIPFSDPTYNTYHEIFELPQHVMDEMAHFFTVYKSLENKDTIIDEIRDAKAAKEIIQRALDSYVDNFCR